MRTVLVADDEKSVRDVVSRMLERGGYRVLLAQDGEQAWDLLQGQGVDLAVLDINMPRLDGWELMKRIRSDARLQAMPVLMLTVRDDVDDQVAGYELGGDDYLTKPFDSDLLLARVRILERRVLGGPA